MPQGQPPVPGIQPAPAPVPQNEPPILGILPHEPKPPGDAPPELDGDEPPVDPAEPRPPYAEAGLGAVVREVIKWVARVIGGRGEPGNPGMGRPPSAELAPPVAGAPLPGPVTVPPVPPFPGVPSFDPMGAPVPPSPEEEFPNGIPGIASPLPADDPLHSDAVDGTGQLEHNAEFPPNPDQTEHIFGDRPGHIPDTPENRERVLDAVNEGNYRDTDQYGNQRHFEVNDDGSQTWVHVRNGVIQNAGVNAPGRHR